nr:MAG TPA: hypothetical protein [Caudoviricetes sp.]
MFIETLIFYCIQYYVYVKGYFIVFTYIWELYVFTLVILSLDMFGWTYWNIKGYIRREW